MTVDMNTVKEISFWTLKISFPFFLLISIIFYIKNKNVKSLLNIVIGVLLVNLGFFFQMLYPLTQVIVHSDGETEHIINDYWYLGSLIYSFGFIYVDISLTVLLIRFLKAQSQKNSLK